MAEPCLTGSAPEAHRIAADAPAGLGLPPVVDHRLAQHLLRPVHRRRVGALAGEKQRAEFRQVILLEHAVNTYSLPLVDRYDVTTHDLVRQSLVFEELSVLAKEAREQLVEDLVDAVAYY